MRKYKMTKMPIRFYLPMLQRFFSGKVWQFTILRDFGVEIDFRKKFEITDLLTDKEKKRFWLGISLLKRKN